MIVSIHQPNFVPWYPYFQKMAMADVFIILTHCQFEKNNYQNRFLYKDKWQTMSVNRGLQPIRLKTYLDPFDDWQRIKSNGLQRLEIFDDCIGSYLAETNFKIIQRIADLLKLKTRLVLDHDTGSKGTDRLVDLCKAYNAHTYIAGPSGANYMDLKKFERADIKVVFQENQTKRPIIDVLTQPTYWAHNT